MKEDLANLNPDKLRGVNFGGWLVLEKWMTPSLFAGDDAEDEYTFCQKPENLIKLEKHRREFITEEDFQWLSENGINAVRIPVGYWLFTGDGPFSPCITYLDWAVKTAKKYKIKVLISLHSAPGSQNGQVHSGRIGKALWFKNRKYREQTIEVLEQIAEHYHFEDAVWGLELLNEPKTHLFAVILRRFYKQAYRRVIKKARVGLVLVYHDSFTPRMLNGLIWPYRQWPVAMDIHWYQFTFWAHKWVSQKNYERLLRWHSRLITNLQRKQPIIIGEWSAVLSTHFLRRFPKEDHELMMDRHAQLQIEAYEVAEGWFYWSYKTDGRGIWNFRSMVEDGRIVVD